MTGWKAASVVVLVAVWAQTAVYAVTGEMVLAGVALLVAIAGTVMTTVGWDS